MQKMLLMTTLLLGVMGIISGCKKSAGTKTTCQIIGFKNVVDSVLEELVYDSEGRISVVVTGQTVYSYEYGDHIATITSLTSGLLISKTTAINNEAGLAVNIKQETTQTGVDWFNTFCEYDGEKLIRTTQTASDKRAPSITNYQWTDGNLTSTISGTDTTRLTYYTDKPDQAGGYLSLAQIIQGYEQIRSKNLLKSLGDQVFTYKFATDGKISDLVSTFSGAPGLDLQLQYECH